MEQRNAETDFDPTPARLYQNRLYRWLSPDDFTGGPVDAIPASLGGPDPMPPGALPYADILNPQSRVAHTPRFLRCVRSRRVGDFPEPQLCRPVGPQEHSPGRKPWG
jgi:hypothetical protein